MRRRAGSGVASGSLPATDAPGPAPGPIRIATAEDAAALVALEVTCFPPAERFSPRTWWHLLGSAARRGSALTHVVPAGDGIGAAISTLYRRGSAVARIYSLAVDPAQRGRGLAKALMDAAAEAAIARGCTVLSLEVRSDNAAANGLYEKQGFTPVGVLRHYYARGHHATRYRRLLKAG